MEELEDLGEVVDHQSQVHTTPTAKKGGPLQLPLLCFPVIFGSLLNLTRGSQNRVDAIDNSLLVVRVGHEPELVILVETEDCPLHLRTDRVNRLKITL